MNSSVELIFSYLSLCAYSEVDQSKIYGRTKLYRSPHWDNYRYRSRWRQIIQNGVTPEWKSSFVSQVTAPPNHGSAARALNAIIKQLRAGQESNRYLIFDIDLLPQLQGVTCSPFGAVPKGDSDLEVDVRIIHDHSYSPGESVNDNTVSESEVEVCYDGPKRSGQSGIRRCRCISLATTNDDGGCQWRI
eukprot:jgi/Phyca11/128260/e_gw1.74.169.1